MFKGRVGDKVGFLFSLIRTDSAGELLLSATLVALVPSQAPLVLVESATAGAHVNGHCRK